MHNIFLHRKAPRAARFSTDGTAPQSRLLQLIIIADPGAFRKIFLHFYTKFAFSTELDGTGLNGGRPAAGVAKAGSLRQA